LPKDLYAARAATECVPTAIFTSILAAESARPDAFDYGPTEGDQRLRAALADLLGDLSVAGHDLG
jgi:DNA-binding transcriptional MocR family regulator